MKQFYKENIGFHPAIIYTETPPENYELVTSEIELIPLIKQKYNERSVDGLDFMNRYRVRLIMRFWNQEISQSDAVYIDRKLNDVKFHLMTGDWLTAHSLLSEITTDEIFTEGQKNELVVDFVEYISNNY